MSITSRSCCHALAQLLNSDVWALCVCSRVSEQRSADDSLTSARSVLAPDGVLTLPAALLALLRRAKRAELSKCATLRAGNETRRVKMKRHKNNTQKTNLYRVKAARGGVVRLRERCG